MSKIGTRIADIAWPAIVILLLLFLMSYGCVWMTPRPERFLAGSVGGGEQALSTWWPYGHQHELVLGVPDGRWGHPPDAVVAIRVSNADSNLVELTVHPTNMVSCGWLKQRDVQGFILTWPNTKEWSHSLVPGQQYSIRCDLSGNVARNSTLWVTCLQSGIDRWRTRRNRTSH